MEIVKKYLNKISFTRQLLDTPMSDLNLCIVIPCFKEPNLIQTLESLWKCDRPKLGTEIIVVINSPDNCLIEDQKVNEQTLSIGLDWANKHRDKKVNFEFIYSPNLPNKHAGVGWARKIGMDEATSRLHEIGNYSGVIVGFDADSTCDSNYLIKIEQHFQNNTKTGGASIYFEHPLSGDDFPEYIYEGIAQYELHLRYLNQALNYTKHPFAYHTVGSSFAVKMIDYVKQGGMNRRQAGEDFYFLQKVIESTPFSNITTTCVRPSPRLSDRVPFGTGAAMNKWKKNDIYLTYSFETYKILKNFFKDIPKFYVLTSSEIAELIKNEHITLLNYLDEQDWLSEITTIKSNSGSLQSFVHRFFRWFNAFKVIKFLNYAHEKEFNKQDIIEESLKLATAMHLNTQPLTNVFEILHAYRIWEQKDA